MGVVAGGSSMMSQVWTRSCLSVTRLVLPWFYWVLLGFTGFYWVSMMSQVWTRFCLSVTWLELLFFLLCHGFVLVSVGS